ncbi:hypothetical protein Lser_V15G13610 [Lactuca serriola]
MAESSSVQDTSVHSNLLVIKPNQNLIIDLMPSAYEPYMLQILECLKYSPLVIALSQRIHFDIHNEKTSISKNYLCALLGLAHEPTIVNPDSITTGKLFSMVYNMGYTETLTTVTKFKKSCLPPQWNGLFTLLFKGLSKRSAGSDGASKSFMTMLYGLYNVVPLDYCSVLWQQLSLVSKWAMDRLHVPIMADSLLSSTATFHTTKILVTDPSKYLFVGSILASMYVCVSNQSAIIQAYKKLPSSSPRELTPAMVRSIEKADKPSQRGKKQDKQNEGLVLKGAKGQTPKKRKTEKAAPSQPKQKKTKKPARGSESSDEEVSVRGATPPRSLTPEVPVRSKAPSPPPASIPISLPTTFWVITSQPSSMIPIPTPIFVDATTTTTMGAQTNISNAGVHSSAPETPVTTQHSSFTRSTDTNTVLGGEDLEFDSTYFSPYHVQRDDNDDAPITNQHLKVVTDKLDQLLSSSSATPYSEAALKALFSSAVKEHDNFISNAAKEGTAKVEKLISEAQIFLDSLEATAQKNANTVTASVDSLKHSVEAELSQNFCYHVVRANNVSGDFLVADFPLMNLNDLIQVALILKDMDASQLQGTDKEVLRLGLGYIKIFIDNYYDCLALIDVELSTALGKKVKVAMEVTKSQSELKKYVDGEICLKPLGLVFSGKDKNGKAKRFLFQENEVERYTTAQYTNFMVRMNNYTKNNDGDKAELKKVMSWYTKIRRMMHFAAKILSD